MWLVRQAASQLNSILQQDSAGLTLSQDRMTFAPMDRARVEFLERKMVLKRHSRRSAFPAAELRSLHRRPTYRGCILQSFRYGIALD
jgi:hypothetical protein